MRPTLILASSSQGRANTLKKLRLTFHTMPPEIDETPYASESALCLVKRLAELKAKEGARLSCQQPNPIIIAGDQVITLKDRILGKPKNHEEAMAQLQACSGNTVTSHASLCIYHPTSGYKSIDVASCTAKYRLLNTDLIQTYLALDTPYHCAGSLSFETLGYFLLEELQSQDPYSIYGMPLMRLISHLNTLGISLLEMLQASTSEQP